MRRCRYRQWVWTLGIMAATPGIVSAGPLSMLGLSPKKSAAKSAQRSAAGPTAARQSGPPKSENQKAADGIAAALRKANFSGYDIQIEFNSGVAKLTGMVSDPRQKVLATEVVSRIPIVRAVDNQLIMPGQPAGGYFPQTSPVQQTSGSGAEPAFRPASVAAAGGGNPAAGQSNQQVAEQIAGALRSANLSGYDIEIRYKNGTAGLLGAVATEEQRIVATQVVSQVPGVRSVENQLQVNVGLAAASATAPARPAAMIMPGQVPVHSVAYQPPPGPPALGPPAGPPPGAVPPGMAGPYGPPGMPVPPSYGHPGSGAAYPVYNQPHLPEYAWPSYASYPNSAQISYPKEYSASAWPYIGPFYPYPQVPLGWRQVQLEWDDGYWNLNFKPRTDKWWWFLHPKNWD